MDDLLENKAFCKGVQVGIGIHQKRVIAAHERGEPVKIGEELYYLQSGRERLAEMINKICK